MTRGFTGRHMLAIMLAFFGVVVTVNFTMATLAARTFGGTVVDNSYVAGQRFNAWLAEGRAQERLGWRSGLALDDSRRINVALSDREGPLSGAEIGAVAQHPLGRAPDVTFAFRSTGAGRYVSVGTLPPGRWSILIRIRQNGRERRLIETLS
ncbi:MAG: FixH family protein [Allosphingosinicella sp.]